MAKTYTLKWSQADRTIVMTRPGKPTIKFGNQVPQGVIRQEAAKIAKAERATLVVRDDD